MAAQAPSPRRPTRYAAVLLPLLVLGFLGWLAWARWSEPAAPQAELAPLAEPARAPFENSKSPTALPLNAAASAPQTGKPTKADLDAFEAAWCSPGLQAAPEIKDLEFYARSAIQTRLNANWHARLRAQGDLRSLATAALLPQRDAREQYPAAFTQALWGTSDPYVLQLWRAGAGHCSLGSRCIEVPEQRWSQAEPANLLAWLPTNADAAVLTPAQWHGIANARYVRSHLQEGQLLLLDLMSATPPSLELAEGLEMLKRHPLFRQDRRSLRTLVQLCTKPEAKQLHRDACLHAASLFWHAAQPSLQDPGGALRLADELGAREQALWASRRKAWLERPSASRMQSLEASAPSSACGGLAARRQSLLDRAGSESVAGAATGLNSRLAP